LLRLLIEENYMLALRCELGGGYQSRETSADNDYVGFATAHPVAADIS
jgi:hypothetical protein